MALSLAKSPLLTNEKFCQGFFCGAYILLGLASFYSKILIPILVAVAEASIWLTYVTWDIWWVLYIFVGWMIQYPSKWLWIFALSMSLTDFFVSSTKLIMYSRTANWDMWRATIFFNNFLSFLISFLFFFYLFSYSTRKEFGVIFEKKIEP